MTNQKDTPSILSTSAAMLSQTPNLAYHTYGSASLKIKGTDLFGQPLDELYYVEKGASQPEDFHAYQTEWLKKILTRNAWPADDLEAALAASCVNPHCPLPSTEILCHALIGSPAVLITHPVELMALASAKDHQAEIDKVFNEKLLIIKSEPDFINTARVLKETLGSDDISKRNGILLRHFGLLTFANDLNKAYALAIEINEKIKDYLKDQVNAISELTASDAQSKPIREQLVILRKKLSQAAGTPVLLRTWQNDSAQQINTDTKFRALLQSGTSSIYQKKAFPLPPLDPNAIPEKLPTANILLDTSFGLGISAGDPIALKKVATLADHTLQIIWIASQIAEPEMLPYDQVKDFPALSHAPLDKSTMFTGEVAMVTGAASGIGHGCVLSLLSRGAAVVGLDISPSIKEVSDSPAYLGLICDLTDEQAVADAFEKTALAYGGLDMLVLNAGIFTSSCNIDALSLEIWQKVMRVNLDANLTIMREAYKLLKHAPKRGRVLINSSRNVPAPGPGASAYSVSKAGLTQLGRVAALEWGKDGICVNMINPHAVFDTGIWTDEVLKSRAEKYGITVEEYKTNNVLHVELTSHDIGELVAEMLGPVFSKTTGAQVPADGGSDRVI
ncbi:MAG: SDR family oxidoreductase [Chloroflexota bacterium]